MSEWIEWSKLSPCKECGSVPLYNEINSQYECPKNIQHIRESVIKIARKRWNEINDKPN